MPDQEQSHQGSYYKAEIVYSNDEERVNIFLPSEAHILADKIVDDYLTPALIYQTFEQATTLTGFDPGIRLVQISLDEHMTSLDDLKTFLQFKIYQISSGFKSAFGVKIKGKDVWNTDYMGDVLVIDIVQEDNTRYLVVEIGGLLIIYHIN